MTVKVITDPSTFGLAFYWQGPTPGYDEGYLATHQITIILTWIMVAIIWGKAEEND